MWQQVIYADRDYDAVMNSEVSLMSLKVGQFDGMIPIPLHMRLRASVCQPLDFESLFISSD